jgi:hypothetical protein
MNPKLFFVVDIDGTIANLSHRLHFIEKKPADWDGFFAACMDDEPIHEVIDAVNLLYADGDNFVLMVTGRSDAIRNQTVEWMNLHGVPCDALYMRKAGDRRPDNIVKGELLDQLLADFDITESHISAALEDRDQVVKMYRDRGIRVFQVANGNF